MELNEKDKALRDSSLHLRTGNYIVRAFGHLSFGDYLSVALVVKTGHASTRFSPGSGTLVILGEIQIYEEDSHIFIQDDDMVGWIRDEKEMANNVVEGPPPLKGGYPQLGSGDE